MPLPKNIEDLIKEEAALLLGGLQGKSWQQILQDTVTRDKIYAMIAKKLLGTDSSTLAKAILGALSDNSVTADEIKGIVGAWALAQAGGDAVLQQLIQALMDGKVTQVEAATVALSWAKRQVKDPTVLAFLGTVATSSSGLSVDQAKFKKQLLAFLEKKSGLDKAVTNPIIEAINDGDFDPAAIMAIVTGIAVAFDEDGLGDLLDELREKGQDTEDTLLVVLSWVSGTSLDKLKDAASLLAKGDFLKLLAMVVGALEPGLGTALLTQIANGKFQELALEELTKLLKDAGVNEAGDLAKAIIDLATGARSLFAQPEEAGLPFGKNAAAVAVWHETQEVMYLAMLFAGAGLGDIVSTDPQAVPHLVRAANLKLDTPLSKLVVDPSKKDQRELMADSLKLMLNRHFRGRMSPLVSRPVPEEAFKANSGKTCLNIVSIVFGLFKLGGNPL